MDALVLAHLSVLKQGLNACPDGRGAADVMIFQLQCPDSCLPVATAAGAVAVVQLAMERRSQARL